MRGARRLGAAVLGALTLAACAPTTGADQPTHQPSQAIEAASDGDTIRIAPGTYADCAVIRASHITIEGAGPGVVFRGRTCGGKAILVTSGDDITIRNVTLENAAVRDRNGAGIRAQGGDLTVDGVRFLNNEDGILSAANPHATIRILNSDFEGNGGARAHGIYIGHIGTLEVANSRFFNQRTGHHVKSRALRTVLTNNVIEDGPDGTASYEVDIPSGGTLIMRGNTLEKGPRAENWSTAVTIGEEKRGTQPTAEILIENNRFTNGNPHRTIFVRNDTSTPAQLVGNTLVGAVVPLTGPGMVR